MIAATGVSRTVVREAVAALRADGLVVTRQGVGAFVADNVRRPFRIDFDELRRCARCSTSWSCAPASRSKPRGSPPIAARAPQMRKIADASMRSSAAIERGEDASTRISRFHCSIADATGNPQFRRFLEYLGRFIIPRQTIRGGPRHPEARLLRDVSDRSTATSCRPSAAARCRRRARRCAGISQQPQALSEARRQARQ